MSEIVAYYDDLSEVYPEIARFPAREHVTWPATRSLLGDVAGERVLDAGCGTGEHSAGLAEAGADVVGVDASEGMLATAREQFGDRSFADGETAAAAEGEAAASEETPRAAAAGSLSFRQTDLEAGLPFDDGSFDVVLCQLVLSHVSDLDPVFEAFQRVLADGGRLVVTTHHPFHDFRLVEHREMPRIEVGDTIELDPEVVPERHPPVYHDDETYRISWSEEGRDGVYHRRSLSTLVSALLDAGFALDRIEEPVPDAEFRERWPEQYRDVVTRPPEELCLRGTLD